MFGVFHRAKLFHFYYFGLPTLIISLLTLKSAHWAHPLDTPTRLASNSRIKYQIYTVAKNFHGTSSVQLQHICTVESLIVDTPKRTASQQRTQLEVLSNYFLPIVAIHFKPPKEDNLLTKDKRGHPKVSFIRRFH